MSTPEPVAGQFTVGQLRAELVGVADDTLLAVDIYQDPHGVGRVRRPLVGAGFGSTVDPSHPAFEGQEYPLAAGYQGSEDPTEPSDPLSTAERTRRRESAFEGIESLQPYQKREHFLRAPHEDDGKPAPITVDQVLRVGQVISGHLETGLDRDHLLAAERFLFAVVIEAGAGRGTTNLTIEDTWTALDRLPLVPAPTTNETGDHSGLESP